MNLFVCPKVATLGEILPTSLADEWLFTRMATQVNLEGA